MVNFRFVVVGIAALTLAVAAFGTAHAQTEKRVALVIGNGDHNIATRSTNPSNDAGMRGDPQTRRLHAPSTASTSTRRAWTRRDALRRAVRDADMAVFYYAGHGMQVGGDNYLMPIDAKSGATRPMCGWMERVDDLVADGAAGEKSANPVLDACRDNPLAGNSKRSIGRTPAPGSRRASRRCDARRARDRGVRHPGRAHRR